MLNRIAGAAIGVAMAVLVRVSQNMRAISVLPTAHRFVSDICFGYVWEKHSAAKEVDECTMALQVCPKNRVGLASFAFAWLFAIPSGNKPAEP